LNYRFRWGPALEDAGIVNLVGETCALLEAYLYASTGACNVGDVIHVAKYYLDPQKVAVRIKIRVLGSLGYRIVEVVIKYLKVSYAANYTHGL
jgi:hypothetical protein